MNPDVRSPMPLETPACPLCGTADYVTVVHTLSVRDPRPAVSATYPLQLVRCQRCTMVYLSPRPIQAVMGWFYPEETYHAHQTSRGIKGAISAWRTHGAAKAILRGVSGTAHVLEVGCGRGELLAALRQRGALVMGIEPGRGAAAAALEQGLDVHLGTVETVPLPRATFDRIIMKYALEHVPDPLNTLRRLAAALKPNGTITLWLPNADSWEAHFFGADWRGYDPPRHLTIFTPATIEQCCLEAGVRVTALTYSPVPNDWAGSARIRQTSERPPWSGAMGSAAGLALWFPLSLLAAFMRRAGRMRVVCSHSA